MTQKDRSEVREMIQGVLSGWHDSTVEREKLIYLSLNNIDSHLEKLNGKVSAHERTILENLPHSIAHCPQTGTIKEIRDAIIQEKGGKVWKEITWQRVALLVAMITSGILVYQGFEKIMKVGTETNSEVKIMNDIIHTPQVRGVPYNPFSNDTIK
jgi:hypothetical protein